SDTKNSTCQVACLSQPCVSNVHCTVPVEACDGEHITVKGFATNCDTNRTADVTTTLTNASRKTGRKTCPAVPPVLVCELDVPLTFHCTPAAPVTCSVPGSYTTLFRSSDTKNSTCQVACLSQPCVSNVHCTVPVEACDGEHITVKGFATNCD